MLDAIFPSLSAVISISAIGILFGLILSVAKIKLKVDKDPRIEQVNDALPGANCGACGQPGCMGYATKIVMEDEDITLCPVGDDAMLVKIAEIMGKEVEAGGVSVIARLHCQGGHEVTVDRFEYKGPKSCYAAHTFMESYKVCQFGCLGFGDCVDSCPFDAMYMGDDGLPKIIDDKCTGCGNCVDACPRDILSLVPETFDTWVMCSNTEKAPVMKKGCSVGCIGCKICEKACRTNFEDNPDIDTAIKVINFNAEIDYDLCTNCHKCVEVCPVPVINPVELSKKWQKNQEKKKQAPAAKAAGDAEKETAGAATT